MLVLTRRPDQSIIIRDDIEIVVLGISGNQVQLGVKAPRSVQVHREEIYRKVIAENRRAIGAMEPTAALARQLEKASKITPNTESWNTDTP